MKKLILIYGLVMALLITILKLVEYNFLIRKLDIEFYVGISAILFTGVGIALGIGLFRNDDKKGFDNPEVKTLPGSHNAMANTDLSERELEVLQLMADGLSNQEIADQLFISVHTVKTHSSKVFSKLHVKRRTQAVLRSKQLGLIT